MALGSHVLMYDPTGRRISDDGMQLRTIDTTAWS